MKSIFAKAKMGGNFSYRRRKNIAKRISEIVVFVVGAVDCVQNCSNTSKIKEKWKALDVGNRWKTCGRKMSFPPSKNGEFCPQVFNGFSTGFCTGRNY